jgi:hypothetical protein
MTAGRRLRHQRHGSKNRSYWRWLVDGKIVGLDELAMKAGQAQKPI